MDTVERDYRCDYKFCTARVLERDSAGWTAGWTQGHVRYLCPAHGDDHHADAAVRVHIKDHWGLIRTSRVRDAPVSEPRKPGRQPRRRSQ